MQGIRDGSVPDKDLEGHDGQRGLMGRFENDRASGSSLLHLEPARCADTPAIARFQSGEAKLGHGRAEIIAELFGDTEEVFVHDAADGVDPKVIRSCLAAAGAVEAGHGLATAGLKRLAEDIFASGFGTFLG